MPAKDTTDGPQRYISRKLSVPLSAHGKPWKIRVRRKALKRSLAEKTALKAERQQRKLTYSEALQASMDVVYNEATKLHEQFSMHTVEYYLEELMQRSRKDKTSRKVSLWNVYLRQELERYNSGESAVVDNKLQALTTY